MAAAYENLPLFITLAVIVVIAVATLIYVMPYFRNAERGEGRGDELDREVKEGPEEEHTEACAGDG